jgi:hypothetical protein
VGEKGANASFDFAFLKSRKRVSALGCSDSLGALEIDADDGTKSKEDNAGVSRREKESQTEKNTLCGGRERRRTRKDRTEGLILLDSDEREYRESESGGRK